MTAFRSPWAEISGLALLALLWPAFGLAAEAEDPAGEFVKLDKVVVLANRNVPASLELAHYYLEKRSLPIEQLCVLDLPTGETISRQAYETRLRDPLLEWMRERKYIQQKARNPKAVKAHESAWQTKRSHVSALVSLYGVPVRIKDTKPRVVTGLSSALSGNKMEHDRAAVDSELSVILLPPTAVKGGLINPFYDRLTRSELGPTSYMLVLATRLATQ